VRQTHKDGRNGKTKKGAGKEAGRIVGTAGHCSFDNQKFKTFETKQGRRMPGADGIQNESKILLGRVGRRGDIRGIKSQKTITHATKTGKALRVLGSPELRLSLGRQRLFRNSHLRREKNRVQKRKRVASSKVGEAMRGSPLD